MIEKECKLLLSEAEFNRLAGEKHWDNTVTQTNYYYDTAGHHLHRADYSLRVRESGGAYKLQLKYPDTGESTAYKSRVETEAAVKEVPAVLHLPEIEAITEGAPLQLQGALHTIRKEKTVGNVQICLDENHYLGTVDYELELEFTGAWTEAQALLQESGLPLRPQALGKHGRFLNELKAK